MSLGDKYHPAALREQIWLELVSCKFRKSEGSCSFLQGLLPAAAFTLEQGGPPRGPHHRPREAKFRCLQKQSRLEKLKIAAGNGELDWELSEEEDYRADMYEREREKELGTTVAVPV